jgi:hypothetical protein
VSAVWIIGSLGAILFVMGVVGSDFGDLLSRRRREGR